MQHSSLKKDISKFNQDIYVFEKAHQDAANTRINAFQKFYALDQHKMNHLLENLNEISNAKSLEELTLYKNSFVEVLDSLRTDKVNALSDPFTVIRIEISLMEYKELDVNNKKVNTQLNNDNELLELIKFLNAAENFKIELEKIKKKELTVINKDSNEIEKRKINISEKSLRTIEEITDSMEEMKTLLDGMKHAENLEDFKGKKAVFTLLLTHIENLHTKSLHNILIDEIEHDINELSEAKSIYLPGPTSTARKAVDFGWIILGAALLAVGLAFSAPVAVLVIGVIGLGYGAIDLAKEIAEPIATYDMQKLGERPVSPNSQVSTSLTPQEKKEKAKLRAKKALPIVLSALALVAGIAAFAFPPLAITMAVIGFGLAITGGVIVGINLYQEKKKTNEMIAKHASIQSKHISLTKANEKPKLTTSLKLKENNVETHDNKEKIDLNSEVKIDLALIHHPTGDHLLSTEEKDSLKFDNTDDSVTIDNDGHSAVNDTATIHNNDVINPTPVTSHKKEDSEGEGNKIKENEKDEDDAEGEGRIRSDSLK